MLTAFSNRDFFIPAEAERERFQADESGEEFWSVYKMPTKGIFGVE